MYEKGAGAGASPPGARPNSTPAASEGPIKKYQPQKSGHSLQNPQQKRPHNGGGKNGGPPHGAMPPAHGYSGYDGHQGFSPGYPQPRVQYGHGYPPNPYQPFPGAPMQFHAGAQMSPSNMPMMKASIQDTASADYVIPKKAKPLLLFNIGDKNSPPSVSLSLFSFFLSTTMKEYSATTFS